MRTPVRLWLAALMLAEMTLAATLSAHAATPPCSEEAFHHFDFWVGQWRVEMADGRHIGDNIITSEQGGCVLRERWRDINGNTGTSLNFYSAESGQWRQVWVSPGILIDITGGLREGKAADEMMLEGTVTYQAQARSTPFRGTWTPLEDGRVRQVFEDFRPDEDGNPRWHVGFEGYYRKVP